VTSLRMEIIRALALFPITGTQHMWH